VQAEDFVEEDDDFRSSNTSSKDSTEPEVQIRVNLKLDNP